MNLFQTFFYYPDGFSPFPSILTYFADLSDSNLPRHWQMADSLISDCATVIVNARTGEFVYVLASRMY